MSKLIRLVSNIDNIVVISNYFIHKGIKTIKYIIH